MSFYQKHGKRMLDIVVATVALVVLAPIFLVVALLIAVKLGRPVIFSQKRSGLAGRPFQMFKFRSMTNARGPGGELLPDADRLTRFGRLLRASSLDELPGFWNILKGDMALVGPRPYVHVYLERYNEYQLRRFLARPGLTGWAMVNGRNSLSWEEKLALDSWYSDRVSLLLDLKIIGLTVVRVLRREGASSADGHVVSEFMGTDTAKSETRSAKP